MRYVCLFPNKTNDNYIHEWGKRRIEFLKNAQIQYVGEDKKEDIEVIEFPCPEFDEKKILTNKYEDVINLHEIELPVLRFEVMRVIHDIERDCIHVDLGKSLFVLYAAYFAVTNNIKTNVSFHLPDPNQEKPVFNVGGESEYGNPRNNLRRFLATQVLKKAETVFVDDERIAAVLTKLFPNVKREICFDPLAETEEVEENVSAG